MKAPLRVAMLAAVVFTDVYCALRLTPVAAWLTNPGATLVRAESAAQVAVGLQLRTTLYRGRPNG